MFFKFWNLDPALQLIEGAVWRNCILHPKIFLMTYCGRHILGHILYENVVIDILRIGDVSLMGPSKAPPFPKSILCI